MLNTTIKYILQKYNQYDYKAYIVGGATRDYLLGRKIHDYDITTNAYPDQTKKIFDHTVETGIKFGTVTIVINGENYEVTTFRKDGTYSDGRRPDTVEFSENLEDDLKRRDFTINAICMDKDENIIDIYGGKEDIKHKIIKCIGNPIDRFNEDALRMLRAVRFMSQLDFTISEETLKAIIEKSKNIQYVSIERIQQEFNKILLSSKPSDGIRMLVQTHLLDYFIPEMIATVGFEQKNPYHDKDVFEHIMSVLDSVEPKLNLRLAAFFHDIAKPDCFTIDDKGIGHFKGHHILSQEKTIEIMKRLKYSNDLIDNVSTLVRYHYLKDVEMKDKGVKRFINNVGVDNLDDMFSLNIADVSGKSGKASIEKIELLREKCKRIIDSKEPLSRKDLAINGNDLKKLNLEQGNLYKIILDDIVSLVIDNPNLNTKEYLLQYVKDKYCF